MKSNIHPQYYQNAKVHCACGNEFEVGSTQEFLETEVCFRCHPLYTGKEKIIDTAGRVEKFKQRLTKKSEIISKRKGEKKIRTKTKK